MRSVIFLAICLIPISCRLKSNDLNKYLPQKKEVKIAAIKDSLVYDIFNWVIDHDRKTNKFYSNLVSYGTRLYYDSVSQYNILRIEGTLTDRIFLESEDLLGFIQFRGHAFYLLENSFEIFEVLDSTKEIYIDAEQEIANDDQFEIYFFGYADKQYFRFLPEE